MIVWLASYPRSGNTFCRIVLNRLFGIKTPTVYVGEDNSAFEVGRELVGHVAEEMTVAQMHASADTWFVKTHRREEDAGPALYIHRDGRDSLVSYACKLHQEQRFQSSDAALHSLLLPSKSNTGTWGQNACHWLDRDSRQTVLIRFDDLIKNPLDVVGQALEQLDPALDISRQNHLTVPSFSELQQINGNFFRRGVVGSHKTEMSCALQEMFWAQQHNTDAMERLGYPR